MISTSIPTTSNHYHHQDIENILNLADPNENLRRKIIAREPDVDMWNDPFFNNMMSSMQSHMRQMDNLMGSIFNDDMMFGRPMPQQNMIANDPRSQMLQQPNRQHRQQQDPFGAMMMPFGGGIFGGFGNIMQQMEQMNDPNAHIYSHSTVINFDATGDHPIIREKTHSVRKSGNAKEVRDTMRDSASGESHMRIGHHLGERAHIIEKKRDRNGRTKEDSQFVNLDKEEAPSFDRLFQQHVRGHYGYAPQQTPRSIAHDKAGPSRVTIEDVTDHPEHKDAPAQPAKSTSRSHRRYYQQEHPSGPIVEEPPDDDDQHSSSSKRTRSRMFYS